MMPCIKIIDSIKLYVYPDDHNPPHMNAFYAEHEELIEIRTLKTYAGWLPGAQRRKIENWALSNKDFLLKQWNKFNS